MLSRLTWTQVKFPALILDSSQPPKTQALGSVVPSSDLHRSFSHSLNPHLDIYTVSGMTSLLLSSSNYRVVSYHEGMCVTTASSVFMHHTVCFKVLRYYSTVGCLVAVGCFPFLGMTSYAGLHLPKNYG